MERTIKISESAEITKAPDLIILALTIETKEKKYADAVEQAKTKIRELNMALENAGMEKESAKTADYNVRPSYNFSKNGKLEGYVCVHRLKIEFPFELEIMQKVLDVIPMCLAEPQMNILFTVKEKEALRVELLEIIAKNAKQKAEAMCAAAGATLGKLLSVEYHKTTSLETRLPMPSMPFPMGDRGITVAPFVEESVPQAEIRPNDIHMSDSATFVWEIE